MLRSYDDVSDVCLRMAGIGHPDIGGDWLRSTSGRTERSILSGWQNAATISQEETTSRWMTQKQCRCRTASL